MSKFTVCCLGLFAGLALSSGVTAQEVERKAIGLEDKFAGVPTMPVVLRPSIMHEGGSPGGGVVNRGPGCTPTISSHTDANFSGGAFVIQAGFGNGEIAAASYTLNASVFPIKIDLMEFILAGQSLITQTVTQWSVLVWEGNPNTGTLVAEYSSDDVILPHARVGPGTAGVNIQVSVDPQDPEQIFITNAGGSNTFTIGLRIDQHNNHTGSACVNAPPNNSNAFPTTDNSGLAQGGRNWLFGENCGAFGCPANGGWSTFAGLNIFCRPSGDWVMRATWESINCQPATGSCCITGSCTVNIQAACSGAWTSGGVCSPNPCPQPTGACCFGSTCQQLDSANCSGFGGTFIGNGVACGPSGSCPLGACCLPDGSCVAGQSQPACVSIGTFQGVGSTCTPNNCPQPTGACCNVTTGFCGSLTQATCSGIGGVWQGPLTLCTPNPCQQSGACCNGTACTVGSQASCTGQFQGNNSACGTAGNPTTCCPANFNDVGGVTVQDIFDFLSAYFAADLSADFNGNSSLSVQDIFDFLGAYFVGCPG